MDGTRPTAIRSRTDRPVGIETPGVRASGKPSLKDIADEAGVSISTVSRVLNNYKLVSESMRRRVMDAARAVGYVASSGKRPTDYIALLYPADAASPDFGGFEAKIIAGVLEACSELGFNLAVLNASRDKNPIEGYFEFLQRKCVRGALLRGVGAVEVAQELANEAFPSVLIAERSADERVSFVDAESKSTARRAVEHLIDLGHRRIGFGTRRVLDTDHRDRLDGFREAFRAARLEFDESLVVQAKNDQAGGVEILNRLLTRSDPPTAIVFTTPLATVGALYRCAELGISVPKNLSIVGFDEGDTRLQTFPRYTAICQDARRLAIEATALLVDQVEGRDEEPVRLLHATTLSIQDSTGVPPEQAPRVTDAGGVL